MNKLLNYTELKEEDEMLLFAYMEIHEAKKSDVWFLDYGCSNHICASEGMFSSLKKTFSNIVKHGNNTSMKITGNGAVKLTLHGVRHTISKVYWYKLFNDR